MACPLRMKRSVRRTRGSAAEQQNDDDDEKHRSQRPSTDIIPVGQHGCEQDVHDSSLSIAADDSFARSSCSRYAGGRRLDMGCSPTCPEMKRGLPLPSRPRLAQGNRAKDERVSTDPDCPIALKVDIQLLGNIPVRHTCHSKRAGIAVHSRSKPIRGATAGLQETP